MKLEKLNFMVHISLEWRNKLTFLEATVEFQKDLKVKWDCFLRTESYQVMDTFFGFGYQKGIIKKKEKMWEKENTKGMGITDMPCTSEEEDLLEISKYVKGLGKFIRECQTPMSIAIQGDWGNRKTSTLNLLKKNLEADKDTNGIKCVFFNTWQYSQFNMEDSLYVSFVHNLVKQCGGNDEILKTVAGFGKLAFFKAIDWKFGTNASEILDGFEKAKKDQMESVSKLQEDFAELVKKTGKRLVIFIDDLDRLNPEVAVELLEIIKLFVNVENSIFVLAIDYEVVKRCS